MKIQILEKWSTLGTKTGYLRYLAYQLKLFIFIKFEKCFTLLK